MCEICENMFDSNKIRDLWDRSCITVVTITSITLRRIGEDIEYRLDVCKATTGLPTYRFIKTVRKL
jgi:hypothetical protein